MPRREILRRVTPHLLAAILDEDGDAVNPKDAAAKAGIPEKDRRALGDALGCAKGGAALWKKSSPRWVLRVRENAVRLVSVVLGDEGAEKFAADRGWSLADLEAAIRRLPPLDKPTGTPTPAADEADDEQPSHDEQDTDDEPADTSTIDELLAADEED